MKTIEEILLHFAPKKPIILSIRAIQKRVAEQFGITTEELLSNKRNEAYAFPRHLAMYLCREFTGASYPLIAQEFNRDHSTAIYAYLKIGKLLVDNEFPEV